VKCQTNVGKAVNKFIGTYINGVSLKKDAKKVFSVLRMEQARAKWESDKSSSSNEASVEGVTEDDNQRTTNGRLW